MEDVEDEQQAGRPSSSRISDSVAKIKALLDSHNGMSVRVVEDMLGHLKSIMHRIVTKNFKSRKIVF